MLQVLFKTSWSFFTAIKNAVFRTADSGLYQCLYRNIYERIQIDGAFDWVATQALDVTFVSGYSSEKMPQIVAQTAAVEVERLFNLTLTCAFTMG